MTRIGFDKGTTPISPEQTAPAAPTAQVTQTAAPEKGAATPQLPPADLPGDPKAGFGLPVAVLAVAVQKARGLVETVASAPLPETAAELVQRYSELGHAVVNAEACLLSALDALDPRTGGGVAQPTAAYADMRARAFATLRAAGEQFARFDATFSKIVHGPGGWERQPIVAREDRGDGRPLYHYRNSYKKPPGLSPEERLAEHVERVETFRSKGGRFEDLIVAEPGIFDQLRPQLRYDYVMQNDGLLRMSPNEAVDGVEPVKPGHSLLAVGGAELRDEPILLAGELWIYKDTAGDVEAVVLANNSGHFKPHFNDLPNALTHLEKLGLPTDRVVMFGGPNNLPSMFEEIAEKCGLPDVSDKLPPSTRAVLDNLAGRSDTLDLVSVRRL